MTSAQSISHRVAVLAGDGIGLEVTPSAIAVVDAALHRLGGSPIDWVAFDWGSDYFREHARMMPADAIETLAGFDAILLGAVGHPDVSDVETLWGMLIPIRREFGQYVNLRPVRTLPGVPKPIRGEFDMLIVRENSEGEYSTSGGRSGTGEEARATQETVFTRRGVERITRFAAERARERRSSVTSATKSNGIIHTMPFWDDVVAETLGDYRDVELRSVLIDALAASLVLHPERFDVIVASNLFGDILSDLAAALAGSIGIAPSANLNPSREFPSMFEPVHGSAPDIAGKNLANPVGAMWAAAMMLEHLGEVDASRLVMASFETVLAQGVATADLGGTASTREFTDAVLAQLERIPL